MSDGASLYGLPSETAALCCRRLSEQIINPSTKVGLLRFPPAGPKLQAASLTRSDRSDARSMGWFAHFFPTKAAAAEAQRETASHLC